MMGFKVKFRIRKIFEKEEKPSSIGFQRCLDIQNWCVTARNLSEGRNYWLQDVGDRSGCFNLIRAETLLRHGRVGVVTTEILHISRLTGEFKFYGKPSGRELELLTLLNG